MDGYNSDTANTANTIVLRDASGNFSAGTVTGTFAGNITGNVTGNVSGSSGSCTGNAATATYARRLDNASRSSFTVGGNKDNYYPVIFNIGSGATELQYSEFVIERGGYDDPGYTFAGGNTFSTLNIRFSCKSNGWGYGASYENVEMHGYTTQLVANWEQMSEASKLIVWLRGATIYHFWNVVANTTLHDGNSGGTSLTLANAPYYSYTYSSTTTVQAKAQYGKYVNSSTGIPGLYVAGRVLAEGFFSGPGTGLTGTAANLTVGTANSVTAGGIKSGAIEDNAVIFSKIQQVTGPVAIGRTTASLGNVTTLSGADLAAIIGANTITNASTASALTTTNSYTITGLTSNSTVNIFPTYASGYSYFLRMGYDNSGSYDYTVKRNGTSGFLEFDGTQAGAIGYVFNSGAIYSSITATSGAYYLNSTGHGLRRADSTNNVYLFTTSGNLYLGTTGSSSQQIIINNNGNLGVGTSPTSYKLDVNGSCHATSFPTSSDARFKKNIKPLENCVDKVKKMQGVSYEWNEFINNRRDGYFLNTPVLGVIAQDLEKIIPEVVSRWNLSDDCKDARAVDYIRIIPVLIEAIKEQQVELDDLKNRLIKLENK